MHEHTLERFKLAAQRGEPDQVPVALIVDSPWLPGYAGIDTRDYYLFPEQWWAINKGLISRFPDAVWLPVFGSNTGWLLSHQRLVQNCAFIPTAHPPSSQ